MQERKKPEMDIEVPSADNLFKFHPYNPEFIAGYVNGKATEKQVMEFSEHLLDCDSCRWQWEGQLALAKFAERKDLLELIDRTEKESEQKESLGIEKTTTDYENSPERTKSRTPSTDPSLKKEWEDLYHHLVNVEGLRKYTAIKTIAKKYGVKSNATIRYHLEEQVRTSQIETRKNYPQNRDKAGNAARMHVWRNVADYVTKVLENSDGPLTPEEVTFGIQSLLKNAQMTPVLLKNKTIEKLVSNYEKEHHTALVQRAQYGKSEKWSLLSQAPGYSPPKK